MEIFSKRMMSALELRYGEYLQAPRLTLTLTKVNTLTGRQPCSLDVITALYFRSKVTKSLVMRLGPKARPSTSVGFETGK